MALPSTSFRTPTLHLFTPQAGPPFPSPSSGFLHNSAIFAKLPLPSLPLSIPTPKARFSVDPSTRSSLSSSQRQDLAVPPAWARRLLLLGSAERALKGTLQTSHLQDKLTLIAQDGKSKSQGPQSNNGDMPAQESPSHRSTPS